ncbi:MAG: EamA family transporter [Rhodobacteraceae bacterium]|nr:EamA family transporter [Paracoccaceae bacterium]
MDAWIPITLTAAAAQTVRYMLQKHLSVTGLSAGGATFARFVFSAPLVALFLLAYVTLRQVEVPAFSTRFWAFAITGGVAQILATVCIVLLFSLRNFAVGVTFKKTEVMLTALAGLVILGEAVSVPGLIAIAIGLGGVLLLSREKGGDWRLNRAAGLGLMSGVFFAISAVTYRGATLALASPDVVLRAGTTLAMVTAVQTLILGAWLVWRERGQLTATLRHWRIGALVGVTSMIGSFCWFTAFTLKNAAYVFALGQTELIFSIAASVLFFREKITGREVAGMALISLSVVVLILVI